MKTIDTLEIWGAGGDFAYLIAKGPTVVQLAIGAEPGAISLHREFTVEGDRMVIHVMGDIGEASLVLSVESAAALAEALASLTKNPGGLDN